MLEQLIDARVIETFGVVLGPGSVNQIVYLYYVQ